jgi:hypothetical protein
MARTTAGVAMMVVLWTAGVPAGLDAAPGTDLVVLHVSDSAHVSRDDLATAEQFATEVYRKAGVRAVWTDGAAATAQHADALHVDVLILSREMVARKSQSDGIDEQVFGVAARPARRAYIFYSRIADRARLTASSAALLLGIVIAHEVGHLLLPAFSHSASGIMSVSWERQIERLPWFTRDQATMMRQLLAAGSGNQSRP